jgi:hypothetical protein
MGRVGDEHRCGPRVAALYCREAAPLDAESAHRVSANVGTRWWWYRSRGITIDHASSRPVSGSAARSGVTEVGDAVEVVALVAVTGIKDDVNDVIEPGAFRPRLFERPVKGPSGTTGSVLSLSPRKPVELILGDPRLPRTAPDGTLWQPEAGALRVPGRAPQRGAGRASVLLRPRGAQAMSGSKSTRSNSLPLNSRQ